jgi:chromosome segregation ATPase
MNVFAMLSEEQIKKLISANDSLRVQLDDANAMLAAREQEIGYLHTELADATALRSQLDGQLDEIESIQNKLGEKQQAVKGAEERELEMYQELTEMAILNKQYNELIQDYAYLQSRYNDVQSQLTALNERNAQLQQITGRIGELESTLENTKLERDDLKNRVTTLESQKYLREFNL